MIISETMFVNGRPVGWLLENIYACRVTFQPAENNQRLAARVWRDVNTATRAIQNYYHLNSTKSKD
jgi:hypothetical protein